MNFLSNKNVNLLLTGSLISLIGTGIQTIASSLYILDVTGSGSIMGTFATLSIVPALLTSPFAGILGDRLSKKKIMISMDLIRGGIVLLLGLITYLGKISIPLLFISQIMIIVLDSFFDTSSVSIVPELIDNEQLGKVNALKSGVRNISMILGPVLGGVVYGFFGIQTVFLMNGISFMISALCDKLLTYNYVAKPKEDFSNAYFFRQIKEVVLFIKGNKPLKQLFLFILLINLFDTPITVIILPFLFKKTIGFNSQQYGIIQASLIGGMLLGNIIFTFIHLKIKNGKMLKISNIAQYMITVIFAFTSLPVFVRCLGGASWTLFFVAAFLLIHIGLFNAISNTIITTNLQKTVSSDMLSRFFSIAFILIEISNPVGLMIFGALLDVVSVHIILICLSVALFLIILTFFFGAVKEFYEPSQAAVDEKSMV